MKIHVNRKGIGIRNRKSCRDLSGKMRKDSAGLNKGCGRERCFRYANAVLPQAHDLKAIGRTIVRVGCYPGIAGTMRGIFHAIRGQEQSTTVLDEVPPLSDTG